MPHSDADLQKLLTEIAMEDGRLSTDEMMIIGNAMKFDSKFKVTLAKALEDNVIDDDEKEELHQLRKKIFEGPADIAEKDNVITGEETTLLMKLLEYIIELRQEYD